MKRTLRLAACALALVLPAALAGQQPPAQGANRGTRIGLYGFGVRGGFDFRGDDQFIAGASLDVGDLLWSRLRLRPSFEIGVFNGRNTYIGDFEALFRFTDDNQTVLPYLGTGLALAGQEDCGTIPGCPGVWINLVLGLELHYRSTFNWMIEYRGMDLLQRHRFYVGLTTRRGS